MEQFIAVALAHFLALLIPGVDFFLIARTAMTSGWRIASGACLGIALANGIFITAAFSGLSFITDPLVLGVLQLAGGAFLIYIGVAFLRAPASPKISDHPSSAGTSWIGSLGLGLASGLLNPKNILFYVSLGAAVSTSSPGTLALYGVWMVTIVLVWDLFVAIALGSPYSLAKLYRTLPWLTRAAGLFLVVFGLVMVATFVLDAQVLVKG